MGGLHGHDTAGACSMCCRLTRAAACMARARRMDPWNVHQALSPRCMQCNDSGCLEYSSTGCYCHKCKAGYEQSGGDCTAVSCQPLACPAAAVSQLFEVAACGSDADAGLGSSQLVEGRRGDMGLPVAPLPTCSAMSPAARPTRHIVMMMSAPASAVHQASLSEAQTNAPR